LLDQPKLRQLKQRVTLHYQLDRLKEREVGSYIDYRLRAVGYERNDLFTPDGLEPIVIYSKGIPRLINVICDNALLITYASSKKKVSGDDQGSGTRSPVGI
jgi:type II secretory pathway predicted ATPase ExeA